MEENGRLLIGEVARAARVNIQTLRYYERRRLLRPPQREPNGYRRYDGEAVRIVRFVKQAQALGFSLKEIKELLALRLDPRRSCGDVRVRAEAKLADIDQKIAGLRAMKVTLTRFIAACSGRGPVRECPILDALDEDDMNIRSRTESNNESRRR
jgi:MerR family mercuric resistance operon transcriptional regulator